MRWFRNLAACGLVAFVAALAADVAPQSMPQPAAQALTASRALASDPNGLPSAATTTLVELNRLSGVTSAVQTQLDAKLPLAGGSMTGPLLFTSAASGLGTDAWVGKSGFSLSLNAPSGGWALQFMVGNAIQADVVSGGLRLTTKTANTVPYLDGSKMIVSSAVTPTELAYLAGSGGVRVRLSADRTYYVATGGNDSNDCLTVGTPCLTPNQAITDALRDVDTGPAANVIVQLADGTYTGQVSMARGLVGGGRIILQGNTGTPANVILSVTSNDAVQVSNSGSRLTVSGMEVRTTTGGSCLRATSYGALTIGASLRLGACASAHMQSDAFGGIALGASYSIVGSSPIHYNATQHGTIGGNSITVTLTGTPAFSGAFAVAGPLGALYVPSITYSGSATGTRYNGSVNGVIFTNGAGASYFPGNVAGAVGTGAQYN